jgi:hypothetical protein
MYLNNKNFANYLKNPAAQPGFATATKPFNPNYWPSDPSGAPIPSTSSVYAGLPSWMNPNQGPR